MRRIAPLLLAMLAVGCADNQETLIVLHAAAWDDDGTCIVDPNTDDVLGFGVLDLAGKTPYIAPLVLLNNSGDQRKNNTGVDSNEIQLIDAEVTIESVQAPDVIGMLDDDSLTHFTAPLATNSIPAGGTLGVGLEVLPQGTVNALADAFVATSQPLGARVTVTATVVFTGTRTGNDVGKVGRVKARDFSFPIQLCMNCLLYCGGCTNADGDLTGCPQNLGPSDMAGGVCGSTQDLPIWPSGCVGPDA